MFLNKQKDILILSMQRWHFWAILFVDIFLLIAAKAMARGFNKVVLMGNLARDPEVRYMVEKRA